MVLQIQYYFLKLKKLMYKSQIIQLNDKDEMNKRNGWRRDRIGGRIVEREVCKYGKSTNRGFERENG
jgi:hypothetical protein